MAALPEEEEIMPGVYLTRPRVRGEALQSGHLADAANAQSVSPFKSTDTTTASSAEPFADIVNQTVREVLSKASKHDQAGSGSHVSATVTVIRAEIVRLENSIVHLQRTNIELQAYDDDADCRTALIENETVIEQQRARITALNKLLSVHQRRASQYQESASQQQRQGDAQMMMTAPNKPQPVQSSTPATLAETTESGSPPTKTDHDNGMWL